MFEIDEEEETPSVSVLTSSDATGEKNDVSDLNNEMESSLTAPVT